MTSCEVYTSGTTAADADREERFKYFEKIIIFVLSTERQKPR